ncbi:MAG TPA: hypothetical protein VKR30_06850 [Candidatus Limnocylindrales bacterium]|nr:hypothetical protein [Candidatus Limnocylindrales bacterium]
MQAWRPFRVTRNTEAPWLFESFFIAAVASFLGIRWFLALTNYPKIGTNGLHIAHMLWGGLLMLVALLLLLGYLDRNIHHAAAIIAGLGFGTFIDEIGKFVTSDNDYFYRPAVALVYVAFVGAYLVARAFVGRRRPSPAEALANALGRLAGDASGPLQPDERGRIARLLSMADAADPGTRLVVRYLAERPGTPERSSWLTAVPGRLARAYERLMENAWAERAITVFVVGYAIAAVAGVGGLVAATSGGAATVVSAPAGAAQLGSTVVGAVLVVVGAVRLASSRLAGYHWMLRGLLVWILVTQVFVFYSSQLAGLGGLVVDLAAYGSLRFAIARELLSDRELS